MEKTNTGEPMINKVPARIKMIRETINTTFLLLMLFILVAEILVK
jgi:hypothetical protein